MNDSAILINVDRSEETRSARRRILERAGFTVRDASTEEAWKLVSEHLPDLVLLHLPGEEAAEFCRRLKADPQTLAVLLLQLSGRDELADAWLMEPIDPEVLVATVRSMLRLRKAERELAEANARLAKANEELRRSNEDLQQFAFVASHDLQEPLRTVTAFVQLIEQEAQDRLTDVEKGYFTHVVSGANRMRSLIHDLLSYSQVGRNNIPKGPVDMTAVVAWALENVAGQAAEAGAEICVDEPLPRVIGDFAQLGQVMQNLLSNAIKYRNPDAPLRVQIGAQTAHGKQAVIHVRDNGSGIAVEHREKIFAPFKRLHGPDIPGTGIGLAVCRRIVDSHGGRLWVDSQPGEGSTFLLSLPLAPR